MGNNFSKFKKDILDINKIPAGLIKEIVKKADSIAQFSRVCKGMLKICKGITTKYKTSKQPIVVAFFRENPIVKIIVVDGLQIQPLSPKQLIGFKETAKFYNFTEIRLKSDIEYSFPEPSLTGKDALMAAAKINEFLTGTTLTCNWLIMDTFIPYVNEFNIHFNFRRVKFRTVPAIVDAFNKVKNCKSVNIKGVHFLLDMLDFAPMLIALRAMETSKKKFGNAFKMLCCFNPDKLQKCHLHPIFNLTKENDKNVRKTSYYVGKSEDEYFLFYKYREIMDLPTCGYFKISFYPTRRSLYEYIKTIKKICTDFWYKFDSALLEELECIVDEASKV